MVIEAIAQRPELESSSVPIRRQLPIARLGETEHVQVLSSIGHARTNQVLAQADFHPDPAASTLAHRVAVNLEQLGLGPDRFTNPIAQRLSRNLP